MDPAPACLRCDLHTPPRRDQKQEAWSQRLRNGNHVAQRPQRATRKQRRNRSEKMVQQIRRLDCKTWSTLLSFGSSRQPWRMSFHILSRHAGVGARRARRASRTRSIRTEESESADTATLWCRVCSLYFLVHDTPQADNRNAYT